MPIKVDVITSVEGLALFDRVDRHVSAMSFEPEPTKVDVVTSVEGLAQFDRVDK